MGRVIAVEGFKAFHGTMNVDIPHWSECVVCGDWLYRPDTDCWYCGGKSYPAEICRILEVK